MTSVAQVLSTVELLEMILLDVDNNATLLLSQRVNRFFCTTITNSKALQEKLFFRQPDASTAAQALEWNPLIRDLNRAASDKSERTKIFNTIERFRDTSVDSSSCSTHDQFMKFFLPSRPTIEVFKAYHSSKDTFFYFVCKATHVECMMYVRPEYIDAADFVVAKGEKCYTGGSWQRMFFTNKDDDEETFQFGLRAHVHQDHDE